MGQCQAAGGRGLGADWGVIRVRQLQVLGSGALREQVQLSRAKSHLVWAWDAGQGAGEGPQEGWGSRRVCGLRSFEDLQPLTWD